MKNEFEWRKLSGSVKVSVWVCEGVRGRRRKNTVCVVFVLQCDLNRVVKTGLHYSARHHAIARPKYPLCIH